MSTALQFAFIGGLIGLAAGMATGRGEPGWWPPLMSCVGCIAAAGAYYTVTP